MSNRRPALLAALLVAACETSTLPGSGGAADAGPFSPAISDGGPLDAAAAPDATSEADAGTSCNALVQQASSVSWVSTTAPDPVAAGGPLTDGTYAMTDFKIHTNITDEGTVLAEIGKTTIALAGGTASVVLTQPDGRVVRTTQAWSTSGVNLTSATICVAPSDAAGAVRTGNGTYTATETSLIILYPTPSGLIEVVYAKP